MASSTSGKGKFKERLNNIRKMYFNKKKTGSYQNTVVEKQPVKEELRVVNPNIQENISKPEKKVYFKRYGIPVRSNDISEENKKLTNIQKKNITYDSKLNKEEIPSKLDNNTTKPNIENKIPSLSNEKINIDKKIIDKQDLILKKIKNKLKKHINELDVIESELYLINETKEDLVKKEEIEKQRKKILALIEKVKKIKEQFNIFKENNYLEDIIWLNDSNLIDDIIEYKGLLQKNEQAKNIKKNLELLSEYKTLANVLVKIEDENNRLDKDNLRRLEEMKAKDKAYDEYENNVKEFDKIKLKIEKFLLKQDKAMENISKNIGNIDSEEIVDYRIRGLGKLLFFNAKYFFALLLTPLRGVFPAIAMTAVASKAMIDNLSNTVGIEEIRRIRYTAEDYDRELNYTLYSLNDVSNILDSNIDRLRDIQNEIETKFRKYDKAKVDKILDYIKKMRKILDNNRYKIEKVKTNVNENIKKNEKVKVKVKKLNSMQ